MLCGGSASAAILTELTVARRIVEGRFGTAAPLRKSKRAGMYAIGFWKGALDDAKN